VQHDQGTHSIRLSHDLEHVAACLNAKICVGFEQGSKDLLVLAQVSCEGLAEPVALGLRLLDLYTLHENELEGVANATTV
jgi:hypothetical protein